MSRFIVGLTGGIGSGKTTVANEFIKMGIEAVDADIVAREVVEPGSPCLDAIVEQFGQQMLLSDGSLDRAQLRSIIFADPAKKQWLNELMHPAIRKEMFKQLEQAQSPYVLLIAPLLFENALERFTDCDIVVDVPETVQIERTVGRDNVSEAQVKSIIESQIPRTQRLSKADEIVDNDRAWPEVTQKLATLHQKLLAKSAQVS